MQLDWNFKLSKQACSCMQTTLGIRNRFTALMHDVTERLLRFTHLLFECPTQVCTAHFGHVLDKCSKIFRFANVVCMVSGRNRQ
jgi:hypothetical protein